MKRLLGKFYYDHHKRYTWHNKSRWTADLELFNEIIMAGKVTRAILTWVFIRLIGWIFWESNEANREVRREIERQKRL